MAASLSCLRPGTGRPILSQALPSCSSSCSRFFAASAQSLPSGAAASPASSCFCLSGSSPSSSSSSYSSYSSSSSSSSSPAALSFSYYSSSSSSSSSSCSSSAPASSSSSLLRYYYKGCSNDNNNNNNNSHRKSSYRTGLAYSGPGSSWATPSCTGHRKVLSSFALDGLELGGRRWIKDRARVSKHQEFEHQKPYRKEEEEAAVQKLMQAQMYTPEALKAEALTVNCHRMVQYGLAVPDLLDRYAERACELAGSLNPQQFSTILSAFARAHHRHDKMLKSFSKRMPPRLPQFSPLALGMVCNAYSKFREHDNQLFRRMSAELPHKLPLFEGHQLAFVANSYARLDIKDELLFDDLADEVLRRPEEFEGFALVMVANAFGHFRIETPRLWFVLSTWLLHNMLDLSSRHLVTVLNALAAVQFQHDPLLRGLAVGLADPQVVSELEPIDLGLALNAFVRLKWTGMNDFDTIPKLAERAQECLHRAPPRTVAQLLHASTKLDVLTGNEAFLLALLERGAKVLPEMDGHSLSLLVGSCAKLNLRDVELLTKVAKAITTKVKDLSPQALALLVHGFAKLEVRSEILFYLLAGQISDKINQFTGQGIAMTLNAYGKLGIKNDRLISASRRQLKALAEELTLRELRTIERGYRALEALDPYTEQQLNKLRRNAQAAEEARKAAEAPPTRTSDEELLRRLAEEQDDEGDEDSWITTPPKVVPREGAPAGKAAAEAKKDKGQKPNLWEMFEAEKEDPRFSPGPANSAAWDIGAPAEKKFLDDGDTTQPSQLRDYLSRQSRPERPGRRPVELREDRPGRLDRTSTVLQGAEEREREQQRKQSLDAAFGEAEDPRQKRRTFTEEELDQELEGFSNTTEAPPRRGRRSGGRRSAQ